MPSELSLKEQNNKGFLKGVGKFFKKSSTELEESSKAAPDSKVEELERSLTKEDPLLENNTYNGDKDDERKNSKNKRREEESTGTTQDDEENKENIRMPSVKQVVFNTNSLKNVQRVSYVEEDLVEQKLPTSSQTPVTESQREAFGKPVLEKTLLASSDYPTDYQVIWKASSQTLNKIKDDASEEDIVEDRVGESKSFTETDANEGTFHRKLSYSVKEAEIAEGTAELEQHDNRKPAIQSAVVPVVVDTRPVKKNRGFFSFLARLFRKEDRDVISKKRTTDESEKKHVEIIEPPQQDAPAEKKWWGGFKLPGFGKKQKQVPQEPVTKPKDESRPEPEKTSEEKPSVEEITPDEERVSEHKEEQLEPATTEPTTTVQPSESSEPQPSPSTLTQEEKPPEPAPRKRTLPTIEATVSEEEMPRKPIRRRPRKSKAVKIKEKESSVEMTEKELSHVSEDVEEPAVSSESLLDDEDVLAVVIHQTDHLRADLIHMQHPVVRVSVVDGSSGSLLRKSSVSRRVTSYYENENVTSILPVMTQPYDFRKNKSVLPRWEETIIFNESFESMIAQKNVTIHPESREGEEEPPPPIDTGVLSPSPILFFVVRDFVSMTKANNQRKGAQDATERGWHTIAWAFLKLVGSNGKPNTDKKLRLQLYHPVRSLPAVSHAGGQSESVYLWYRDYPRRKYPSTLYVSVKPVKKPKAAETSFRSMFALQPEGGLLSYKEMHEALKFADKSKLFDEELQRPRWTRLPGQSCKVPNAVILRLWTASDGAFSIRFSNKGLLLAVACKHGNSYPVLFYRIPGGEEMGFVIGHQQLVYDIHWSNDDRKVVTSSGDGTAQVWELNDKTRATHILPHPSYVYTGAFHPSAQHIVATGGYDAVIRVWNIATENAQILQELEGHKSFINSLAFDNTHLTLYSVDSAGVIIAWNCHTHEQPTKNFKTSWNLKTKLLDKEIADVCINSVHIHKGNKKLLLHCRDSIIRMFDVRINTSLKFTGSVNRRQFLRSALTPCGTFVISGSEDGCAYVWNAESSDQVAIYNELGYPRAVRDVTFHPHDHIIAFCCFSPNMPVLVFKYDKDATAFGGELLSVVGSTSGTHLNEAGSDLPPSMISKVEKIKMQLDSVVPEEPPVQDPWLTAKKMAPVAMAVKAFSEKKKASASSTFLPPRDNSPSRADQFIGRKQTDSGVLYSAQSYGSTWSALDSSLKLQPSFLSPHASTNAKMMAKQLTSQQADEATTSGWKPTFTAVGRSPYRSESNIAPDVSFTVDKDGNRTLRVMATPDNKKRQYVVALFDYQANRSDELTLERGDVIKVLYKDGHSWWFGEKKKDKKQGYFPTNYVVAHDEEETEEGSPEVLFGVPEVRPISADSERGKMIHALKMENGKVKFYSQSESEGEDESKKAALSLSSRQRRREQRGKPTKPLPRTLKTETVSRGDQTSNSSFSDTSPRLPPMPRSDVTPELKQQEEPVAVESTTSVGSRSSRTRKRAKKSESQQSVADVPELKKDEESDKPVDQTFLPEKIDPNPLSFLSPDRPHFGVLKAVQAKMAERDALLSETIVDGAGFSKTRSKRLTALDPVLTSTVAKERKLRKARQKHRASRQSGFTKSESLSYDNEVTDDVIPMVNLKSSRRRDGTENLAYDDVSEV